VNRAYLGRSRVPGFRLRARQTSHPMRCDHRWRGEPLRRTENTCDATVVAERPRTRTPLSSDSVDLLDAVLRN